MSTGKYLRSFAIISILFISSQVLANPSHNRPELPKNVLQKVERPATETLSFDGELLNSRFASWGISSEGGAATINLLEAWKNFKFKKEVVVAVIDTGIDPEHPFLQENIYTTSGKPSPNNFGVDFSKDLQNPNQPLDQHGHGTHVSGIIKSVFPKVKILPLKYYNAKASGQDNLNSTIEALKYAVDQNVDVINYSGGGPEPALEELRILKLAEKKGILVVAAAGNEEANIDIKNNAYYPASYGLSNIVTVTAYDQSLKMLSSSNYGQKSVDLAAPGYRIRSAFPSGRAGYLTGTSQATAFVTGVAALLKSQYPDLSTSQIKKILTQSAKQELTLSNKCASGGRLDAASALDVAKEMVEGKSSNRNVAQSKNTPVRKSQQTSRSGKILYRISR